MHTNTFLETSHSKARLAQRGFRQGDVDWITAIGTAVEDGFLVLDRDVLALERELKRKLEIVHRLKGKRIVIDNGRLITAYHAEKGKEKHLLRKSRNQRFA